MSRSKQNYIPRGSFDPRAKRKDGTLGKYIEVPAAPKPIGRNPDAPEIDPEDLDFSCDFFVTLTL